MAAATDREDGYWDPASGGYDEGEHGPERASGSEMDEQRKQNMAYQYLCHLEEAKVWMEACLKEELPETTALEEALRCGVHLAKLGNFFDPKTVPLRRIFDKDSKHFVSKGLHFRHTDNINYFFKACDEVGLPQVFYPETTDIYDKKNMPKLIYCIHALSLFLFKLGLAPQIQDLYGKAEFTEEQISAMRKELEKYGLQMPAFSKIGGILESELPVDEAALHAAVIAINEAIDHQDHLGTLEALRNPNAHLSDLDQDNADEYQVTLFEAKSAKAAQALVKSPGSKGEEDIYDKLLTQAEIQGYLNQVNESVRRRRAQAAMEEAVFNINKALAAEDPDALRKGIMSKAARLKGQDPHNMNWYMQALLERRRIKEETTGNIGLIHAEIQEGVTTANSQAESFTQMQSVVVAINASLDTENAEQTHALLMKPEAMMPKVQNRSAFMYHDGLSKTKQNLQQDLAYEDIYEQVKVLSVAAAINAAIEKQDSDELIRKMNKPHSMLSMVDETLAGRYLDHFVSVKQEKAQDCGVGKDDLTPLELQLCVEYVNTVVQEENECKNPMLSQGAFDILSAIQKNEESAMEELGFDDIPVNAEFEDLLEDVLEMRPNLSVQCGAAMRGKDRVKKMKKKVDVLNLLLEYIELRGLRMVDFFRQLDKDGSKKITRAEFMAGVKKTGIPMTRRQLKKLVNILDVDNDGNIDYGEMVAIKSDDVFDVYHKKNLKKDDPAVVALKEKKIKQKKGQK